MGFRDSGFKLQGLEGLQFGFVLGPLLGGSGDLVSSYFIDL